MSNAENNNKAIRSSYDGIVTDVECSSIQEHGKFTVRVPNTDIDVEVKLGKDTELNGFIWDLYVQRTLGTKQYVYNIDESSKVYDKVLWVNVINDLRLLDNTCLIESPVTGKFVPVQKALNIEVDSLLAQILHNAFDDALNEDSLEPVKELNGPNIENELTNFARKMVRESTYARSTTFYVNALTSKGACDEATSCILDLMPLLNTRGDAIINHLKATSFPYSQGQEVAPRGCVADIDPSLYTKPSTESFAENMTENSIKEYTERKLKIVDNKFNFNARAIVSPMKQYGEVEARHAHIFKEHLTLVQFMLNKLEAYGVCTEVHKLMAAKCKRLGADDYPTYQFCVAFTKAINSIKR